MKNRCDQSFNHCLYFSANSLVRSINRLAEQEFMITGLAPSYAFIQMIVNQQPVTNQNEIAARMNLAPSTVTRFLDKLESQGLIMRESEGKTCRISPTVRGLEKQPVIEQAWSALYDRYKAILGQELADRLTDEICSADKIFEQ
jgi:MarR family transcriptional regulator, organic hydroperoxide resistance regulator